MLVKSSLTASLPACQDEMLVVTRRYPIAIFTARPVWMQPPIMRLQPVRPKQQQVPEPVDRCFGRDKSWR